MKAVLLIGHGGPECLQFHRDVPVPTPAPGEVLLKVGAAAINNTDINVRVGWYSKTVSSATDAAVAAASAAGEPVDGGWDGSSFRFPRIQGIDACGRIVAVGEGVESARIGQRVLVDPVIRPAGRGPNEVEYLGAERDGAFAEYVAVPAANAHVIVSACSDVELASLPCAAGTAGHLIERAGVRAEDTVLVTGASGGVGSAAVQLAAARGARVIGIAQAAKHEQVRALGAFRALDREADIGPELGAESVDVVVDVVGGAAFPSLLQVLRRGGRYAVAGAIGGPCVELDLRTLYLKDLTVLGCTVPPPGLFGRIVSAIEAGVLRPVVSAVYP
ncbi:MAG: zinc-binding dehydrogenase, partial [Steroidobacteraceae bacterium]